MKNLPLFDVDQYKKILAFALAAHGKQKTPTGLPYSYHIVSVSMEVINSLPMLGLSYREANIAITCALLHDIKEDTKALLNFNLDITDSFVIFDGVDALTKNTNLPTKQEQMIDSLNRLLTQDNCIQLVKLCDRITNLDPAPAQWSKQKIIDYKNEAILIHETLKNSNEYLADKLLNKIENYLT